MCIRDSPARCVNALEPLVEKSLGFNLFFCESSKGKIRVTEKNEMCIRDRLYDLAKLQQGPLDGEAMTKFVNRSNDIMVALTQ